MVKGKYVVIALGVVIAVMLYLLFFARNDELAVRKQFDSLGNLVTKQPGEQALAMASKVKGIGSLFADPCVVELQAASLSGTYNRRDIEQRAAMGRNYFRTVNLMFYDHVIEFPEENLARVEVTGRLVGESTGGEEVSETRELNCELRYIDKEWLFTKVEEVQVLER